MKSDRAILHSFLCFVVPVDSLSLRVLHNASVLWYFVNDEYRWCCISIQMLLNQFREALITICRINSDRGKIVAHTDYPKQPEDGSKHKQNLMDLMNRLRFSITLLCFRLLLPLLVINLQNKSVTLGIMTNRTSAKAYSMYSGDVTSCHTWHGLNELSEYTE